MNIVFKDIAQVSQPLQIFNHCILLHFSLAFISSCPDCALQHCQQYPFDHSYDNFRHLSRHLHIILHKKLNLFAPPSHTVHVHIQWLDGIEEGGKLQ
jgi:hypothetical protein